MLPVKKEKLTYLYLKTNNSMKAAYKVFHVNLKVNRTSGGTGL